MRKLSSLKHRIENAKKDIQKPSAPKEAPSTTGIGRILNVGVEFVSGVLAGIAGGLFIDWIFGTSPWGLISLFILGAAAGFLNVYRTLANLTKKT